MKHIPACFCLLMMIGSPMTPAHSFSNPQAGDARINRVAYDPKAAPRSWKHMQAFFEEIFAKKGG